MSQAPPLYRLGRWFFRSAFEQMYQFDVSGADLVPTDGPLLVASNHLSYLDPPAVGSALPRPAWFFARKTLMRGPVSKWILESVQTVPVDRDGDSDVSAMRRVIQLMSMNQAVVLFPEGTRSPDGLPRPIRPGIGWLACRSGAPILPTRVEGTFEIWNRDQPLPHLGVQLRISFGHPITPDEYDPGKQHGKERYAIANQRIAERLDQHWSL